MSNLLILNGPNLGRLGVREPDVYGSTSFADLVDLTQQWAAEAGFSAEVRQTDDEAEIIGWLHEAVDRKLPVIINPAAFTHYSYGLRDAAAQVAKAGLQLIEVHISNPHAREAFRHTSVISEIATGTIAGFGVNSYRLAIAALA